MVPSCPSLYPPSHSLPFSHLKKFIELKFESMVGDNKSKCIGLFYKIDYRVLRKILILSQAIMLVVMGVVRVRSVKGGEHGGVLG
jgi:hypothetical protein